MSSHAHGLRASELRRKFNGFGPAAKTWGRHNNQQCAVTERANADNKRRRLTRTRHFVRLGSRFEPQRDQSHVCFLLFCFSRSTAQRRTAQHSTAQARWLPPGQGACGTAATVFTYLSAIYASHAAIVPVLAARLVFSHHDTVMHRSVLSHAMARPNVGLPCQELARRSSRNKRARRIVLGKPWSAPAETACLGT
jgi:hypothetical protein